MSTRGKCIIIILIICVVLVGVYYFYNMNTEIATITDGTLI